MTPRWVTRAVGFARGVRQLATFFGACLGAIFALADGLAPGAPPPPHRRRSAKSVS